MCHLMYIQMCFDKILNVEVKALSKLSNWSRLQNELEHLNGNV
jgi:hypothetical protein